MWRKTSSVRRWWLVSLLYSSVLPGVWGCGAKPAAEDADMKKAFSQKTFDINQVPAKDRERVRAIMESQKALKK